MAVDAYQPCPCGSGKKLKFCCSAIIGEMERVFRLCDKNQLQMALQSLDSLELKHADNPWIALTRAEILHDQAPAEEALHVLENLLKQHPGHKSAVAYYARVCVESRGYQQSRAAVLRAFQLCIGDEPELLFGPAIVIAEKMLSSFKFLAARQFLVLAMRLASSEERSVVFRQLLELDGTPDLAYFLRGSRELRDCHFDSEELQNEAVKAKRLAHIGCFILAAKTLEKLTEQEPGHSALWYDLGLCQAWDGDDKAAAAFHQAASLEDNFDTAVEYEAVAQYLDTQTSEDLVGTKTLMAPIPSVAKFLSLLDDHNQFIRQKLDRTQTDTDDQAATYHLLDREPVEEDSETELELQSVPRVIGRVVVRNLETSGEPHFAMIALEGEQYEKCLELIQTAAADQLESLGSNIEDNDSVFSVVTGATAASVAELVILPYLPPKTSFETRKRIQTEIWRQCLHETWPNTALAVLDGKTPMEVRDDENAKLKLAAAVETLAAFAYSHRYAEDFTPVREQLNVPIPTSIEVDDDTALPEFSSANLMRVAISSLTDSQLLHTLNRAYLIQNRLFLYRVLEEVVGRNNMAELTDFQEAYVELQEIARDRNENEAAFGWINLGIEDSQEKENAFLIEFSWRVRELTLRMRDPSDPELQPLLQRLWDYYGTKIPTVRDDLESMVRVMEIDPPWDSPGGTVSDSPKSNLILPSAQEPTGAKKKLILPGQ